jgi:hypothetical protein
MLRSSKAISIVLGAAFMLLAPQAAEAACKLVKATASAESKASAAKRSQALAVQHAEKLKRQYGWSYVSIRARRVKADPFWKAVRPDGPPPEAVLKPDIITKRFFTTCFTGVVVPYVCTTGSAVCGK